MVSTLRPRFNIQKWYQSILTWCKYCVIKRASCNFTRMKPFATHYGTCLAFLSKQQECLVLVYEKVHVVFITASCVLRRTWWRWCSLHGRGSSTLWILTGEMHKGNDDCLKELSSLALLLRANCGIPFTIHHLLYTSLPERLFPICNTFKPDSSQVLQTAKSRTLSLSLDPIGQKYHDFIFKVLVLLVLIINDLNCSPSKKEKKSATSGDRKSPRKKTAGRQKEKNVPPLQKSPRKLAGRIL